MDLKFLRKLEFWSLMKMGVSETWGSSFTSSPKVKEETTMDPPQQSKVKVTYVIIDTNGRNILV